MFEGWSELDLDALLLKDSMFEGWSEFDLDSTIAADWLNEVDSNRFGFDASFTSGWDT